MRPRDNIAYYHSGGKHFFLAPRTFSACHVPFVADIMGFMEQNNSTQAKKTKATKKTTEELQKEKERLKKEYQQKYKEEAKKIDVRIRKQLQAEKIKKEKAAEKLLLLWAKDLMTKSKNNQDYLEQFAINLKQHQKQQRIKNNLSKMSQQEAIKKAQEQTAWIENGFDFIKQNY